MGSQRLVCSMKLIVFLQALNLPSAGFKYFVVPWFWYFGFRMNTPSRFSFSLKVIYYGATQFFFNNAAYKEEGNVYVHRSDCLTKPGQILFVFLTHVSNCLCLLIFGNQLNAVYFGADEMSFVACGVVVTWHSTVPLEGCLSSLCSFPGFAEVNGGIPFVWSSWCHWHHGTEQYYWEYIWHQSLIEVTSLTICIQKALWTAFLFLFLITSCRTNLWKSTHKV